MKGFICVWRGGGLEGVDTIRVFTYALSVSKFERLACSATFAGSPNVFDCMNAFCSYLLRMYASLSALRRTAYGASAHGQHMVSTR